MLITPSEVETIFTVETRAPVPCHGTGIVALQKQVGSAEKLGDLLRG